MRFSERHEPKHDKNDILKIIVNLPAVKGGVGVLIVSAVTGEVVGVVVVNMPTATVGIGFVFVVSEIITEVVGVYDTIVIPTG